MTIAIIGGGPAGSVCGAELAKRGHQVVLFERARFPRFQLGESLLPASLPYFESLGVLDKLREKFIWKHAAHLHHVQRPQSVRYPFKEAFNAKFGHAFQVPRDEFDQLLLDHAKACGVDVREETAITRIAFDNGRARGVEGRTKSGDSFTFDANFVVDASGRAALLAREHGGVKRVAGLDKTAFFSHYKNVWRDTDDREGDIQIVWYDGGWFWFIPFRDGRTSVGAVVASEWLRDHRDSGGAESILQRAIAASPHATRFLEGATQIMPAESRADFSFRVPDLVGEGWVALGDAGGFIDPLFSTGVHLGVVGASTVAIELDRALRDGNTSKERFGDWSRWFRRGAETLLGAVQTAYSGLLIDYIFAQDQHPFLRRSIVSLLAGDVFEDSRWLRELQKHLKLELH